MDAINKLALLGLQKDNVELPKIVTIGDQSAGKSSVIAAISGITVPRKDSTCTRVCNEDYLLHAEADVGATVSYTCEPSEGDIR